MGIFLLGKIAIPVVLGEELLRDTPQRLFAFLILSQIMNKVNESFLLGADLNRISCEN